MHGVCEYVNRVKLLSPKALRFLFGATAVLGFGIQCFGQLKTDSGIYTEPALPSLPSTGSKTTDPVFGTTIMRMTDSADGSECRVQYSYWPAFNVNNTYVQATCIVNGGEKLKVWRFDPAAFQRGSGFLLSVATPSGWSISPTDAIWSGSDPNVIFGHPVNAQTINATNVTAGTNAMLKDLTGALPSGGSLQQMSKSVDDNVFAFNVDVSGGRYGYVVWRRDNNNVFLQQDSNVDEVQIDKTGRYLTVVHNDGSDRVWDLSTGIVTDLGWNSADQGFFHHDSGQGTIMTGYWSNGLAYRPLSNPRVVTRLLTFLSGGQDNHYSMLSDDEGWATISRYSTSGGPVNAAFDNELFQVATDGSGRVRRLAHHRSVYKAYNDSPKANISRDGRYVAFTSNWGGSGRRDVYVVQVPSTSAAKPTASLSASPTSITSGQTSTLSWSTTGATGVSISPGVGAVAASGSTTVAPTATTTYTITATNGSGTTTQNVTVSVAAGLPSASISATPTSITAGQTSTLQWSTSGATSVSVTGLGAVAANGSSTVSPATTTTYTITASNASGSVTKSVTINVGASGSPSTVLRTYIEAESGALTSPMRTDANSSASGGSYISSGSPEAGAAVFTFTAPSSGTYVIWARVLCPDSTADSFYVSVDGGPEDVYDAAEKSWSSLWQWTVVNGRGRSGAPLSLNPRTFSLSAGTHSIRFRNREQNTKLDRIFVTNDLSASPATFTQYLEAEGAALTSPMAKASDSQASSGAYVSSPSFEAGTARFTVTVPTAGNYYLWARVIAADPSSDSFYVSVDGTAEDVYDAAESAWSPAWQWNRVIGRSTGTTPRVFSLGAGSHTFQFRGREPNTKLDRIFITSSSSLIP